MFDIIDANQHHYFCGLQMNWAVSWNAYGLCRGQFMTETCSPVRGCWLSNRVEQSLTSCKCSATWCGDYQWELAHFHLDTAVEKEHVLETQQCSAFRATSSDLVAVSVIAVQHVSYSSASRITFWLAYMFTVCSTGPQYILPVRCNNKCPITCTNPVSTIPYVSF